MLVHIVDPSAYTPPYDDALCSALARAGAHVELYTSRFTYGDAPAPAGYERIEAFYRLGHAGGRAGRRHGRLRRASKLAEHVPDMLAYRRRASRADVVHFQWLAVQALDAHLLPRRRQAGDGPARPRLVITAHDILPREPRPGQRAAQARLYAHFDAIVVHSAHGRDRLIEEVGVDAARVHVIPHGVLRPWERRPATQLPSGFPADGPRVVLFFGLLRPYKGIDVLLEAWRELQREPPAGAPLELWIVGMPRMATEPLRRAAPPNVRFLERFVGDAELSAFLRRAELVVLPYREIDASGAAFTALGAGVPLLLSDAGGFSELASCGAARVVPAGDAHALARALHDLASDTSALTDMSRRAAEAAAGRYSWAAVARETLALYGALLDEPQSTPGVAAA